MKATSGFRVGTCSGPDCDHAGNYGGLCWAHYHQRKAGKELRPLRRPGTPKVCSFDACDRQAKGRGLCQAHYRQSRTGAGTLRPIRGAPAYRYLTSEGYIRLFEPTHPNADKQGRVSEHTKVMASILGRALLPDETVHHRNGVRDDNSPKNLELWTVSQPKGQRVIDKIEWAREFLARYAEDGWAA